MAIHALRDHPGHDATKGLREAGAADLGKGSASRWALCFAALLLTACGGGDEQPKPETCATNPVMCQ